MRRLWTALCCAFTLAWISGIVATARADSEPAPSAQSVPKSPGARLGRLLGRGVIAGMVLFAFGGAGVVAAKRRHRERR